MKKIRLFLLLMVSCLILSSCGATCGATVSFGYDAGYYDSATHIYYRYYSNPYGGGCYYPYYSDYFGTRIYYSAPVFAGGRPSPVHINRRHRPVPHVKGPHHQPPVNTPHVPRQVPNKPHNPQWVPQHAPQGHHAQPSGSMNRPQTRPSGTMTRSAGGQSGGRRH